MSDKNCRYNCTTCNKLYASSNSLWNHNKKFHKPSETIYNYSEIICNHSDKIGNHLAIIQKEVLSNLLVCKYCKKEFNHRNNRWRHEKTCKLKMTEIIELKDKIKELENKIINNKSNKIINNKLNNINNSNNNINNGIVNNTFIINKIGEESINKLKFDDIKNIFREQKNCLYHAIKYVNFNDKIPENYNFYNSSLEGKYINVFNNDNNEIEKKNKKDFFDTIILSSINIMNMLYDKIKDDLSKKKQLKLINMMDDIKNIAYLDNSKKIYITNFNEISYDNKKIIKKTWNKKLNDLKISENNSSSDEDSDSSKDSFCYVTDNDE